jgi:Fe-S-cluster containining protein
VSAPAPDCRTCGACCLGQLVVLTKRDRDVPILALDATGTRLAVQGGRCVALRGRPGVSVTCSIYDRRPEMCRVFKAGSRECREVRAAEGM